MTYLAPATGSTRFGALGLTLALNGAAVVALIAWNPKVIRDIPTIIDLIEFKPKDAPPPPEPTPQPPRQRTAKSTIETPTPRVPTFTTDEPRVVIPDTPPVPFERGPIVTPPTMPEVKLPDPVLVAPRMKTRADDLQPPYPPQLQRLEVEGSLTVRILIGADGRPQAIEFVAGDERFFAATQSWGLRRWRFTPATRDGTPIEGRITQTVQFRLQQ